MTQRISLDELVPLANKLRALGGGCLIDGLVPSVPQDSSQCILARAFNFECEIDCENSTWTLNLANTQPNRELAAKINSTLDWELENSISELEEDEAYEGGVQIKIVLPDEIAQVAIDFDQVEEIIQEGDANKPEHQELLREFWPYIEASRKEAYANAPGINEDGELIL